MEAAAVDWSALVFAASLVAVGIAAWRIYAAARKRTRKQEASPLELRDLLRKRDMLVQQLREVEDTAAEPTAEQLSRDRDGRELEEVLRELDRRRPSREPPRRQGVAGRATASISAGNPVWRGFLWGTASTAAVALLLFLVYTSFRPKERGGSVLGRTPMAGAASSSEIAGSPSVAAREAQLRTAVAKNPEDVEARLELARLSLVKEDWKAAFEQTREVLKRSPDDARALTYLGVIRSNAGQPEVAVTLFKRAIAKKPDLLEPYLQLAFVYFSLERDPDAATTLAVASRRFPEKAAMLSGLLDKWRRQAEQQQAAAGAPPGTGAQTRKRVAGVLDLDPALRGKLAASAVVFVIVRRAGAQGPPVAAKRFSAAAFPVPFSVGEADAMGGQVFPDSVRIDARVDTDGNPATVDPADPSAFLDGVTAGTTDLKLRMAR